MYVNNSKDVNLMPKGMQTCPEFFKKNQKILSVQVWFTDVNTGLDYNIKQFKKIRKK